MSGVLYRLHQLAQSSKRTPREDFLTPCVGRQLLIDAALGQPRASDPDACGGPVAADLRRFASAPVTQRDLHVQSKAPARTQGSDHDGAVDLLLTLRGPSDRTVVIEAKVGSDVPKETQLERYAEASPGLVEADMVRADGHPNLTCDDVLTALPRGEADPLARRAREELLESFVDAGVGDPRLVLPPEGWSITVEASKREDVVLARVARSRRAHLVQGARAQRGGARRHAMSWMSGLRRCPCATGGQGCRT